MSRCLIHTKMLSRLRNRDPAGERTGMNLNPSPTSQPFSVRKQITNLLGFIWGNENSNPTIGCQITWDTLAFCF